MPSDLSNKDSVALGAYWKDQLPDGPYRILPDITARLVRVLLILLITIVGVPGVLAGFVAIILFHD
jgi:hypothetical protein